MLASRNVNSRSSVTTVYARRQQQQEEKQQEINKQQSSSQRRNHGEEQPQQQKQQQQQQQQEPLPPGLKPLRLGRLFISAAAATVASAAASVTGWLVPVEGASALDSLPPFDAPLSLDADIDLLEGGSTPELLTVMTVVVITYVGLMILYFWLAAWIDEVSAGEGGGLAVVGDQLRYTLIVVL